MQKKQILLEIIKNKGNCGSLAGSCNSCPIAVYKPLSYVTDHITSELCCLPQRKQKLIVTFHESFGEESTKYLQAWHDETLEIACKMFVRAYGKEQLVEILL